MGTRSLPGVKQPGSGINHPPPPSTEVKGVLLSLYSPSVPSWQVTGWSWPLQLLPFLHHQSDLDQCYSSARLIYIPVWPLQWQPKHSGVCMCAECIPRWIAVICVMVMLKCEVLLYPVIVCIQDRLPAIASLVYYCAVLTRLGGRGRYKLPGPIYDTHVFVFISSIIICWLYKLTLLDLAQVTLQLTISLSNLV